MLKTALAPALNKATHLTTGENAELAATHFLKKQGIKILDRNKRYKGGEIDIIGQDNHGILFIEVKYRRDASFGSAAEMVNTSKQNRLRKAATLWLQEHDPKMSLACRFDVICITNKNFSDIQWIQNAF